MKRKLQKLFCIIAVIITITNLCFATISEATTNNPGTQTTVESLDNEEENNIFEGIFGGLGFVIDGVVGILSKVIQIPLMLIGMAFQGILTGIASLGNDSIQGFVTPDDIFFNRISFTNINFFDLNRSGNSTDTVIYKIRVNIATWYYILRILAVVILLAILIYVGIRMAISTVASDQAKYKQMLMDWAMSFALLFFLGYIILFTLEANTALIEMLGQANKVVIGDGVVTQLAWDIVSGGATKSWAALIVYFALIGMTFAFLLAYTKRMLTVGFLIIISPLITITYSIDKMKDGQAQALNTWMKEFMFAVLIQPFHIIIYLVFVSSALNILSTSPSLAKMFLAIICMSFIWTAEKIVKKIFGFDQSQSLGETLAAMNLVRDIGKGVRDKVGKATSTGGKVISKTKFGQNVAQRVNSSGVGRAYNKLSNWSNNTGVGRATKTVVKTAGAVGIGAAAAGFEIGTGSPANAAQVGLEGYKAGKAFFNPGDNTAPGSKQQIQLSEQDLKRFSDLISKNNNFNFANYNAGNTTSKNNLKAYAQSLIGANMNNLNNNIQIALSQLMAANPTEYNTTTAAGNQHLLDLQNAALDPNLDFNNPRTNPLGHAWTNEEKQVVTATQIRNLADAVNKTHGQYQAAGRANPTQDIDSFIDSL